jgi:hypothetical protein
MAALACHPEERGKVARKGCRVSSAWVVSMFVYIKTVSHEKKDTLDGSKLMVLKHSSRCVELWM